MSAAPETTPAVVAPVEEVAKVEEVSPAAAVEETTAATEAAAPVEVAAAPAETVSVTAPLPIKACHDHLIRTSQYDDTC